ncbi:MAG: hypothetical protein ACK4R6_11865 [Spirosomataceae bacterium]
MDDKKSLLQKSGVTVNYHYELMQNYVPESIIDFGKGLKTIKETDDKVFLFFVDKSNFLQVLVHSDQEGSGWKMHRISEEGYEVTSFDVYESQVEENRVFRISYARRKDGNNQLFVSALLFVDQVDKEKWNCKYNWDNKIVLDRKREIDHITMDEIGVLYSTNFTKTDANFCHFKYADEPALYLLPENGTRAQQIQLGKANDDFGVFILYYVNNKKTLLFTPLEADEFGERTIERYSTGNDITNEDITCFDLLPDSFGNSVVYVAGKGIYRFIDVETSKGIQREKEEIVSPSHELSFSRLDASQFEKNVALWLIGKSANKSGLFYVNNRTYTNNSSASQVGKEWTRPLQMHANTDEFVSVKGPNLINQLYLAGQTEDKKQEGLIHFWQDKVSTQWHEHFLNVDSLNETIEIESYTIELAFSSEKTDGLQDKTLGIYSDENMVLYINNRRQFLLDKQPVTFDLAENQTINLVYPVKSLQAGKIILSGDFLDESIEIEPSSGSMKKLTTQLSSVDALKKATTQAGKPLVSGVSEEELKNVAAAMEQMQTASDKFQEKSEMTMLRAALPELQIESFSPLGWAQNAVGDLYHAVEKGFETITSYVVEVVKEGYKIVLKIAGQVLDFIVDTAKKVVAFVEKVFNSIKTFFKDLFEYLAFLFSWDDIIATKNAIKGYTLNLMDSFEINVGNFQKYVIDLIQQAQNDVQSKLGIESLEDPRKTKNEGGTDSRLNWVASKKEYIGKSRTQGINGLPNEIKDSFMNAFDEIAPYLIKYKDLLADSLSNIGEKFYAFFVGELSLLDFLNYLALSLANVGLELAKDLVTLLFNALKAAIRVIKETLVFSIEIPFFSALYKKISGGADLSIIEIVCLLIAVPTTVAYKIGVGEAPFKRLNSQEFIDSGKMIFEIDLAN